MQGERRRSPGGAQEGPGEPSRSAEGAKEKFTRSPGEAQKEPRRSPGQLGRSPGPRRRQGEPRSSRGGAQ